MRDELWRKLTEESWERQLSRRAALRGAGGLAIGGTVLGALGCGVNSNTGNQADTEKHVKAKIDGDLIYFNWSEYLDPKLIKKFEKLHGIKVRESNFDNLDGMMAKLRAGNRYDIIFPDQSFVGRLLASNQLLKIDHSELKNFHQIYDVLQDPKYDPGSAHSVPYGLYATGVIWRDDKVKDMTGSWNDLFREDAKGKIFVLDDYQEAIGMSNFKNGFDLNETDQNKLDKSKETLIDQKPLLRGYSTDDIQNMLNGNAWIHHGWNGDVVNIRFQAKNPEIYKFEKAKEGLPVGVDTMTIPANAPHPGTALVFIDFMLDPENAAQNINYFGYPMPNKGADQAFADLVKDDPEINVTVEDLKNGEQYAALDKEDRAKWDRVWTEVKAS